jgi:Zn-dependent M28 family amino/carboxypeptidase
VRIDADAHPVSAHNVGCVLPGRDATLADTAIVFTAHYDHLGVTAPDATGDSIYNGFSDNAAGVAMLLAIADAAVRDGGLGHSLLFLFLAGEEQGLLGSDFYVTRPAWPLDRVAGVINLDAGAPPARPWNWRIAGGDDSALGTLAVDVAMAMGGAATTSPPRPNSDYYPFWRLGVPAIFIVPGNAPYEGLSSDSSEALRERWDRYHQRSDEWAPDFPLEGLARYADYARRVGWALDHLGR